MSSDLDTLPLSRAEEEFENNEVAELFDSVSPLDLIADGFLPSWIAIGLDALRNVPCVDGIYIVRMEEVPWGLLVAVREHTDDVYEALVPIEVKLDATASETHIRVSAHQCREASSVAPADALTLYER